MSINRVVGPRDGAMGMRNISRFRKNPLEFLAHIGQSYGDLAFFRLVFYKACLVTHPDLVREVLITKRNIFPKHDRMLAAFRQIDGQGLVTSEGELWARQRRLITPSFQPSRLGKFVPLMAKLTEERIARWKSGEPVDIVPEMTSLTLSIIARALFGIDVTERAEELGFAVHVLSEIFTKEIGSILPMPDWMPITSKKAKRLAVQMLDNLIRDTIRERRKSGEDRGDVLSMLLIAVDAEGDGKGMSDEQARDEAMTLFNGGHDTTAAALAWVWYLAAIHPEAQARLFAEAKEVVGSREVSPEDLPKLVYTERFLKETLRLYPPAWVLFAREAMETTELGGHRVPKGTWVYLSPYVTQRDPRFFPEPDRFDPDRWAPERANGIPPYGYFPFGGGPHACIGAALAMNEMKTIVPTIVRRFAVALAEPGRPVEPEPLLAIRPKGGLPISVTSRAAV